MKLLMIPKIAKIIQICLYPLILPVQMKDVYRRQVAFASKEFIEIFQKYQPWTSSNICDLGPKIGIKKKLKRNISLQKVDMKIKST